MSRMMVAVGVVLAVAVAGLVAQEPFESKAGAKKTAKSAKPAAKPASKKTAVKTTNPKKRAPTKATRTASKPTPRTPAAPRPSPGKPAIPVASTQPADPITADTPPVAPATTGGPIAHEQVAIQAALDNAGFSPGVIDGSAGRKTEVAIRAYQAYSSLPVTGAIDAATRARLGIDSRPATRGYLITAADQDLVAPPPRTWTEKSKVKILGYQSLMNLVAERGHCTLALLGRLNPGVNLKSIKPGQTLNIPNVTDAPPSAKATAIEVDLGSKIIRAKNGDRVVGLYHCSIAADRRKRPTETCTVASIVDNPKYWFDPANWPEVKDVKEKLVIPSGPRNPVGSCWIGLTKAGYGIHGTPEPENIGKTGSHGCFRLTNWDALRLAKMVDVGTQVRFTDEPMPILADDDRPPVTRVSSPVKARKPSKPQPRKPVPATPTKNASIRTGR